MSQPAPIYPIILTALALAFGLGIGAYMGGIRTAHKHVALAERALALQEERDALRKTKDELEYDVTYYRQMLEGEGIKCDRERP